MRTLLSMVIMLFTSTLLLAQGPDVTRYVAMVQQGKADEARQALPGLVEQFPNDPGVMYLQGLLNTDGSEAVRTYQGIIDNFSKSEWADDALFKLYQFYYALGLYRTAEAKLAQLRKDYPRSPHITQAAETDTQVLQDEPVSQPAQNPSQLQPDEAQRFALQVGAYSSQVNAEKQKLFFEDLEMPVEVINRVRDGRSLYLVLVGNFKTADDARVRGLEIRKQYNIESMVVAR